MANDDNLGGISRRSYLKAGIATTGLGVLAGCSSILGGGSTTTLQANSPAAEGSVHGDAAAWLNEYVSDETGGSVEIEAYRNSELGGQIESIENVSSGSLDMYVIPYALTGTQYQPAQVFDAPYLYDPDNPYEDIYEKTDPQDSEIAQQVIEDLVEETDIRSLGAVVQGTRRVTLNVSDEPPRNPDELSEYTMRAVPIGMYSEALKGLGAETTNIDFSEVPQALATGSIQGQENPYNIIRSSGIWENQNYILETNHMHSPLAIIINEGIFQDLSDSEQQALYDGVREIQPRATETLQDNLADHRSFMRDNGLTIVPPEDLEMDAFRSGARSRVRDQFPDLIDTIEQLHGDGYPA
ncbi:TRAP transporter substrate-binding protein DctP [Halobacterium bonnevillei]|uniref:C4-dicarboxylate ABC transporter substrate-binding protein n=1 Tax=Halobacterium bonnevillei TaxID=2692200 RepID=A0A6B0SRG6_9EURY|nr:TRAP transporter substrate-binding protein DctP [Halobacterium bonnevillei]MXR20189.1 C4-dicarboxylate ABC transporter substrate-binding protein [Halobacterium bonnevillei]